MFFSIYNIKLALADDNKQCAT